jgi:hypothetical protein
MLSLLGRGAGPSKANVDARSMLDNLPLAVMTCSVETFEINYVNKSSLSTLRSVERTLPIKVDQLLFMKRRE